MDYGIDLRHKSLHILTMLSLTLAKSAMTQARSDLDSEKKNGDELVIPGPTRSTFRSHVITLSKRIFFISQHSWLMLMKR